MAFAKRLTQRIGSLAASQDLLVKSDWNGVDLAELIRSQLSHFDALYGTRVIFDGSSMRLSSSAAQGIGMALHELSTNAGKYGALSNSDGKVYISWSCDAATGIFSMAWLEKFGPVVVAPTHIGFGQKVIKDMVEAAVDGTTEIAYVPTGFSWKLQAPCAEVLEPTKRDNMETIKR